MRLPPLHKKTNRKVNHDHNDYDLDYSPDRHFELLLPPDSPTDPFLALNGTTRPRHGLRSSSLVRMALSIVCTSPSMVSLFITYSSTNQRTRSGISALRRQKNDWLVGEPLLDLKRYSFRVHTLRFVLQKHSVNRTVL
jgi:hypothetical protein